MQHPPCWPSLSPSPSITSCSPLSSVLYHHIHQPPHEYCEAHPSCPVCLASTWPVRMRGTNGLAQTWEPECRERKNKRCLGGRHTRPRDCWRTVGRGPESATEHCIKGRWGLMVFVQRVGDLQHQSVMVMPLKVGLYSLGAGRGRGESRRVTLTSKSAHFLEH